MTGASASAVTLSLYVGPAVPLPAPRSIVEALTEVTVTAGSGEDDGFELKLNLTDDSTFLQTVFLLSGGAVPPLIRVVVAVTIRGSVEVLMDGLVTQTQVAPDTGPGPTQLIVKGRDISQAMDHVDLSGLFPYPAMPIEARVALILAKYMLLGVVPLIVPTPTVDIDNPLQRIDQHWGTDLLYLRDLAEMVGYTFYVEPGPAVGASIAYWGPVLRIGPSRRPSPSTWTPRPTSRRSAAASTTTPPRCRSSASRTRSRGCPPFPSPSGWSTPSIRRSG